MRTVADFSVLILPGLGGSGPDHWQTHWEAAFPEFKRLQQADWAAPDYAVWATSLSITVAAAERPVVLVAHSLGTALVNRWSNEHPELCNRVAGAFLVAVTDVDRVEQLPEAPMRGFSPVLMKPLPFPSMVVASHDDERVEFARAEQFAAAWGAQFIDAGTLGHIGSAARLGVWPRGLLWFGAFLAGL